jgi:hypothetical protein
MKKKFTPLKSFYNFQKKIVGLENVSNPINTMSVLGMIFENSLVKRP